MTDRILITIIYLTFGAILIGLLGLIIDQTELVGLLDLATSVFVLIGGFLILKNGTFIKKPYFRFIGIGVSAIIIGAMFKIMHWPLSSLILAFGYLTIGLLYLFHQINNNNKKWIDWTKLLFAITFLTSGYFKIIHFSYSTELFVISVLLLSVILFEYIRRPKY